MGAIYTLILDVEGGTYVDQRTGDAPNEAVLSWARSPHDSVIKALDNPDPKTLYSIIAGAAMNPHGGLVPLEGLKSVWFTNFSINGHDAFLNIVKTMDP